MPPKKQNQSNGRKSKKTVSTRAPQRRSAVISGAITNLDNGARAYRNLILDPCNAPLCGPAYDGTHTGIYRRYRRIYSIPATEVETIFVYQPGTNTIWQGGHSAGNAGNPITFFGSAAFQGGSIAPPNEARCLSSCIKVRYVGAESARAGVVGLATGGYFYSPTQTNATVLGSQSQSPILARLGETTHEVKFCPTSGDQNMGPMTVANVSTLPDPAKSCILVCLRGVPAGSVQLEITTVLELDSTDTGPDTTGAAAAVEPSSSNTLNQVLRTLGPVTNWAFNHVAVPTIRSIATGVTRTMANSAGVAMNGVRLLTL